MDDPLCVHVFKGLADLEHPVCNLSFSEQIPLLVSFVSDLLAKVTSFTVFHYNDQLIRVEKAFFELDNVGMVQIFE